MVDTLSESVKPAAEDKKAAGKRVAERLAGTIPAERLKTDAMYTYAYSGDASFFRLIPSLVVITNTEDEVRAVLAAARAEGLHVTFRAAGTSLSGQAVTDGVLCVLGDGWRKIDIIEDGEQVTLGPATIVSVANTALRPLNSKIGPDPASARPLPRSAASSPTIPPACAAVSSRTPITPWRACG